MHQREAAALAPQLPTTSSMTKTIRRPINIELSDSGTLMFRNAAVDADVAPMPAGYTVKWRRFNNTTGVSTDLGTRAVPPGASRRGLRSLRLQARMC